MAIDFGEVYLSSKQILERISEKDIYEYYLGEPIKDKLIRCCFHKDSTPSMGFYRTSSGYLAYRCFSCGATGSPFDLVANLNNISFPQAVYKVQKDFKLSKNYVQNYQTKGIKDTSEGSKASTIFTGIKEIESRAKIIPSYRNFNKIDYDYWNRYYIPLDLLVKYNIKACSRVYVVKKSGEYVLFAQDQKNNPIYCYKVGSNHKIYRPYSDKKGKWTNTTDNFDIQGLEQLPKSGELLIITSSMKDVLVLTVMGYNAIALGGEGNRIPDKILDYLWACFDNIVVFYDNDKAGLAYGKSLSEEIGAGNIFIPTTYEEKDISDLVDTYDLNEGIKLMKELL